jgi:hypothetical protein
MRSFYVKGVKDNKYIDAIANILAELFDVNIDYFKPRFSLTYKVTIDGKDEEKAYNIFMIYAARVGWKVK